MKPKRKRHPIRVVVLAFFASHAVTNARAHAAEVKAATGMAELVLSQR